MLDDISQWLFDSSGLTPHGFCLLWEPGLIWTYAISDAVIGLAYFSIPSALIVLVRKRRDLAFRPLFWLFAAFILLCGATHWFDLLTLWVPIYGLQGILKAATAIVSIFTALALWALLPKVIALPSPAQFREATAALTSSQQQLAQAQKMEAVGQLTGGIAHDFNNMLQAITGALTILELRIEQGRLVETPRYINTIRQAADSATGLTNRLLAFSRRQALQPKPIDPTDLVRGLAELLRRTIGPDIELKLNLAKGKFMAICDPNQLESTLLNLAINARDAMPNGGALTITTAERLVDGPQAQGNQARPGNYVEISVHDTGSGMEPDVLAQAFEPFFTTKPTGQGTGLGLSQVYGFVQQSGGTVQLESALNVGTTVRLYLPASIDRSDGSLDATSTGVPLSADLSTISGTALVVDDQAEIRNLIVDALGEIGCKAIEAHDGPSALKLVQSGAHFDLLITDVGLPGLNGRQVADAARALYPNLPVILITGYAGTALDNLDSSKAMYLLRKPFALDELLERVRAILAKSRHG